MPDFAALPVGVIPFGVCRETAAALIGVGTTKFDEMVKDGRMPHPHAIDGRTLWDSDELRVAFKALDRRDHAPAPTGWEDAWGDKNAA